MEVNYIKHILPLLKTFNVNKIYQYQLKEIDDKFLKSINEKNKYAALDLLDMKSFRITYVDIELVKLFFKKKYINTAVNIYKNDKGICILETKDQVYELIIFFEGHIPNIRSQIQNKIFFIKKEDYSKIYGCGILNTKEQEIKVNSQFYNFSKLINFDNEF